jgi:GT2 family glycosyltransferase
VLQEVNGYDEDLEAGEDWDLQARVEATGYKVDRIDSSSMRHEGRLTLKRLLQKRYYFAKTLPKYIKKHPQKGRIQFMPIRLNFIKNWRILARQPLYCVGMFFMKMLEYAITGIAMISIIVPLKNGKSDL